MMGSSLIEALKYEVKEQVDCQPSMAGVRDCESSGQSGDKRSRGQPEYKISKNTRKIDQNQKVEPIAEKQRRKDAFP